MSQFLCNLNWEIWCCVVGDGFGVDLVGGKFQVCIGASLGHARSGARLEHHPPKRPGVAPWIWIRHVCSQSPTQLDGPSGSYVLIANMEHTMCLCREGIYPCVC